MARFDEIRIPWYGWKIVREIGKGTFGIVYEIERQLFNTTEKAAMKVISIPRDEDEFDMMLLASGYDENIVEQSINSQLQRVEREYALMSQLRGISNIVSCDDFAYVKNESGKGYTVFIRMELLKSIQTVIKDKRREGVNFTEADTIKLGMDICRALVVCEKYGIIHRDIKPQNILVSRIGAYNLGDFGTARSLDHSTHATYAGTVSFMAPEVFSREKYGRSVDIYSLGMVMYWLMNGYRMPFLAPGKIPTADDHSIAENKRMSGEPLPAPSNAGTGLSKVILKACAFRSEDRYGSAEEMLRDLARLDSGTAAFTGNVQPETRSTAFTGTSQPATGSSAYTGNAQQAAGSSAYTGNVQQAAGSSVYTGNAQPADQPADKFHTSEYRDHSQYNHDSTLPLFGFRSTSTSADTQTGTGFAPQNQAEQIKAPPSKAPQMQKKGAPKEPGEDEYERGLAFHNKENYAIAARWFQNAAVKGYAKAQSMLGLAYYYGRGVRQDYQVAVTWLEKAADQGNATAMTNLGVCYRNGQGVRRNYAKAAQLYLEAAKQGNSVAQTNIGECYFYGDGVVKNYETAAEWFRKAAEQGNADAQYNLGMCYQEWKGVEQSFSKAEEWYTKAAQQGHQGAINRLEMVKKAQENSKKEDFVDFLGSLIGNRKK